MNVNEQMITPRQVVEIILKWHWLLIIPFCISVITGAFLVVKLPRIYEAKTVILVQPQKVPSSIVQNIVASDVNDRIATLSQRILSRTNIEKIIKKFNLFSGKDYEQVFMEEKVASIRKRIKVNVKKSDKRNAEIDSFSISFRGKKPENVQAIANYLSTSFIDENLKIREIQVLGTNTFLEDELSTMRKKLIAHEQSLKNYREKYMGGLPEQLNSNLRILDNLNDQLSNVMQGIRNAKERISAIEKFTTEHAGVNDGRIEPAGAPSSLDEMKAQLENYRKRYTEWHPDVIRLKKLIERSETLKEEDSGTGNTPANDTGPRGTLNAEIARQGNTINSEISQLQIERNELLKQIAVYKKRVEDTPKREQELMSLQRDYNNINAAYDSLLGRQLEAQIAVNMEKKQKGEQFRVLDPARLPQRPVSPNIKNIFIIVIVSGFGFGAAIIFLLEYFDTSFREPEELENFLDLPVIATIPTVMLPGDSKLKFVQKVFSIVAVIFSLILFVGFIGVIIIKG